VTSLLDVSSRRNEETGLRVGERLPDDNGGVVRKLKGVFRHLLATWVDRAPRPFAWEVLTPERIDGPGLENLNQVTDGTVTDPISSVMRRCGFAPSTATVRPPASLQSMFGPHRGKTTSARAAW
jgi:hypothetical protein